MPDIESLEFTAPIPGQSLTTEPRGRPWERPSKYPEPEDALMFYVNQISVEDRTAHMLEILESGLPATNLVDVLTLSGVMQGLHTIDTAVLISPALFDLITGVADEVGIEYKDGLSEEPYGEDSMMMERAFAEPEAEKIREAFQEEELEEIKEGVRKTSGGLMSKEIEEEEI